MLNILFKIGIKFPKPGNENLSIDFRFLIPAVLKVDI